MKSDLYLFMHNESNSDSLENWENTNCPEYPNLDYNLLCIKINDDGLV